MKYATLRWICALGSVCILALVRPPVSKRSVTVSSTTPSATVHRPLPISLQPAPAGPRFLVPDPPPLLDSVAVGTNAASPATRFLVPDAAPSALAQATPAPQMVPASFEPASAPKAAPGPEDFVPVVLSTAAPEPAPAPATAPAPAPAPEVVPALQTGPAPHPELAAQRALTALTAASSGLTGLPELTSDGYWIENAPLNEIFQYLARRSELQYFFNNEIAGPEYSVTGHLKLTDPQKQMEDLATAYGLTVYQQGGTIYLMTEAQLAKLPVEVLCYPLKYLRGSQPNPMSARSGSAGGGEEGGGGGASSGSGSGDFTKLMAIIKPLLTREQGQIQFEEKNNVLLVTDNGPKLKKVKEILEQIDRPKQQIVINVRILRVRKNHGSKIGVDWSSILGTGLPVRASQSLNAMFGLPDSATLTKTLNTAQNLGRSLSRSVDTIVGGTTPGTITTINDTSTSDSINNTALDSVKDYTDGMGLVFDVLQMEAIVHALKNDDLVTQESCPTIITEDNEQGNVSFVDRFPIITSTVVATASGTNSSDEVRYKVDEEDPNAAQDPDKSREIGVTLSVTPTLLPDGTVRMRLRPRVANIIDLVTGPSGNVFPRVSESTVEGISRIPAGRSLFLGGFYDSNDSHKGNRVPILGGIPGLGKLFSYNDKGTEQLSLVFIITPRVYDASNSNELTSVNRNVEMYSGFNRTNPGYPVTPLLPPPTPENDRLPLPVDRDNVAPPAPPEARRSWFGRVFTRKAPATKEASMVEPAPGRTRDPHPSL